MKTKLSGKTAIVTGGAKGYGAGMAAALASKGVNVWITGRDQEALEAAAVKLGVHALQADVTSPDDWDRVFEAVMAETRRVDILVNNAGGAVRVAPLIDTTDEEIEGSISVNLTGAILGEQHGRQLDDYKLGRFVYMIDDHDGDGLDEWVVSDPKYETPSGDGVGRITIYRGSVGDVLPGCPTSPNSVGGGARLFCHGAISLRDNLFKLYVAFVPPLASGLFLYGEPVPGAPFGEGRLCVGGTPTVAGYLTVNADGAGFLHPDLFHAPFTHGPGALHVGEARAFQYLYRDPGTGDRNASDSIVIQFVP